MHKLGWALLLSAAALAGVARGQEAPPDALERARHRGKLLWGADAEGGAPYVFADPDEPERVVGFEVDIARELGEELGLEVELSPRNWGSIYQDVGRGAIDFGMNGLEVEPDVLLLDEPTSALDPQLVGEVLTVLTDLAREGQTMIIVTHELRFARQVADHVWVFDRGYVVERGEAAQVFDRPAEPRTQELLAHLSSAPAGADAGGAP